jgi:hypothetical protein
MRNGKYYWQNKKPAGRHKCIGARRTVLMSTLRDRASQLKRQDRAADCHSGLRNTASGSWVEINPKSLRGMKNLRCMQ